ncbi:helicase-exonuclease AddAB subunit AddA [Fructilactobacillus frigidiflavus]|uniref:helicase-exonuclease AddAB subunit AddA n=1 Tax=Fructilactobacillus frigidiflavus TaxID=3242688 RepID=UPI0037568720
MANQWTEGQKQAIYDDFAGNALVSASAGSGKTSVLTERVMDKVTGTANRPGINVDQLLIVTFTNAAAKEMRDRIGAKLREKVNETQDAEQKHYFLQQLRKLNSSHIETMDAFCQWLVKKYYYIINLDPDFRILTDVSELGIIRDRVWNDLREQLYANDQDGSFGRLTRNFSNDRSDDGLTEVLFKLYDFANVNENPEQWLDHLTDFYQIDGRLTHSKLYQQYLLPDLENKLDQMISSHQQQFEKAENQGIIKLADFLQAELGKFQTLKTDMQTLAWDDLRSTLQNFKWARFPSITKKNADEMQLLVKDQIKAVRDATKKSLTKLTERYFFASESDNVNTIESAQKIIAKLVEVEHQFTEAYQTAKRRRHAYEFIDIEHFALEILTGENADSQNLREQFQHYFAEIMVDEYQDNNHLQDAILNSMKNPERANMFMVGDVKQSIYRFRLADPSMFMDKFNAYPASEWDTRITLPDNFRSVKNVDDFTNLVFEQIMDETLGEIDYTGDAHLQFGAKDYPDDLDTKTDVLLYAETDAAADQDQVVTNEQHQVEMIAEKIDELMANHYQVYDRKAQTTRDLEYGDIAILAATKHNNFDISSIFAEHQIPVAIDGSESYFKTTEVQIMMSLLQIIDNPYQDIPLAAVLRSPMVQMDENQMAYLRINQKTGNYFHSVLEFANHYGEKGTTEFGNIVSQKVTVFLNQLNDFKDYAIKHSLAELIWYIYDQTGFLDYAGGMPAGKKRQANLHALYHRAEEYERNGFKGLFAFVQFVKRLQNRDDDLAEATADVDPNSVTVKTIHGSKGLEYPVVILMDATHGFNRMDLMNSFILDDNLGIGIQYFNAQRHEKIPTLQYLAINNLAEKRMLAEEMRKLYVALTRAKQKLIITGIAKADKKTDAETAMLKSWNKANQSDNLVLNESLRSGAKNFMNWIGTAIARHPKYQAEFGTDHDVRLLTGDQADFSVQFVELKDLHGTTPKTKEILPNQLTNETKADVDYIKQIMNFKYQYPDATKTTAYQSVSEIKGQFDDPDIIQLGSLAAKNEVLKNTRYNNETFAEPQFLQTAQAPNSREIGTATHLVFQKLNVYERVDLDAVNTLIAQLVADKLLTQAVADKINRDAILSFYQSELGKRILLYPEKLRREVPFSLIINAGEIFSEFQNDPNQKILVHGIIDGYFEDPEEGTTLFDYKTSFVNPANPAPDIQKIRETYNGQVNLYAKALEDILQQPIQHKYLYLLSNSEFLEIK